MKKQPVFAVIKDKLHKNALRSGVKHFFHDVRPDRLKYKLMFSLAPIFPNMKNSLIANAYPLFGLDGVFLMGIAYSLGIGLIFAFARLSTIARYARGVALASAALFILWLALPNGMAETWAGLLFSLGLGGCSGFALFGFIYGLRDSERLAGAALTTLFCMVSQVLFSLLPLWHLSGLIYVGLQVLVCVACLTRYRTEDFVYLGSRARQPLNRTLVMALFIFFAHRAIVFFYSYLPISQLPLLNGLAGLVVFLLTLSVYFVFKFNIWHMCNIFFTGMIITWVLRFLLPGSAGGVAANVLQGFSHMGFIASYYLLGHVVGMYADFRLFKVLLVVVFNGSLLLHVIPGIIARRAPAVMPLVGTLMTAGLFVVFMLLMPILSRELFIETPAVESPEAKRQRLFQFYNLTSREQDVIVMLIKGMLYKQCADELNISLDTVKFHARNSYRKIGISTRKDLYSLFADPAEKSD